MAGSDQIVQQASQEMPEGIFTPSFKPGMSATVDVQTETARNVVSVPIQSVTVRDFADEASNTSTDSLATDSVSVDKEMVIPEEDLRKVVFVLSDGVAHRREVETGISDNTHIQILNGVNKGEQVVIGSYRTLSKTLSDGDKIKVNNQLYSGLTSN